jgi:hypothetical protein
MSAQDLLDRPRRLKLSADIYSAGGGRFLFVPTETMWLWHEVSASKPGAGQSINAIKSLVKEKAQEQPTTRGERCSSTGPLYAFVDKHREHSAWLRGWFFRGEDAPANVTVATAAQVRWARYAWDFTAHCRGAKLRSPNTNYCRWLTGLLPTLEWLKWQFGEEAPHGVFVAPGWLRDLRSQRTQEAICAAAGINRRVVWYKLWRRLERRFPNQEKELQQLRHMVAQGLYKECPHSPLWPKMGAKTQRCVLRYAKAAQIDRCCQRAHPVIAQSTYYTWRGLADRLGVLEQFEDFVGLSGFISAGPVVSGRRSAKFYVPTRCQWSFREQALNVRAELAKAGLRKPSVWRLDGCDEWFQDWVFPATRNGTRRRLPPAIERENERGPVAGNTEPPARERREAVILKEWPEEHGAQPPADKPAATARRGRAPSQTTEAVYALCLAGYILGRKLSAIRTKIHRLVPNSAPKEDSEVVRNAKRLANRGELPCNRPERPI